MKLVIGNDVNYGSAHPGYANISLTKKRDISSSLISPSARYHMHCEIAPRINGGLKAPEANQNCVRQLSLVMSVRMDALCHVAVTLT
jgi:hypothetical protein